MMTSFAEYVGVPPIVNVTWNETSAERTKSVPFYAISQQKGALSDGKTLQTGVGI